MPDSTSPNWADMAASLLGKLSGGVELTCAFDHVELQVPNAQNPAAPAATWKLNGSVRLRTRGEQPATAPAPAPALRIDPPTPSGQPQPTFTQAAPPSPLA